MAGFGVTLRKSVLLYALVLIAGGAWLSARRSTDWNDTLWVALYPIVADRSAATAGYVDSLDAGTLRPIEAFFAREAARHGVALREPVHVVLGARVREQPPQPPRDGGVFATVRWSLALRYWAWRVDKGPRPPPADVEIFLRYHDPATHRELRHSVGLRKGLVGIANLFASPAQAGPNNVVIAHELLHTLGAGDRYDPRTNLPVYPDGFAEPDASPPYPQREATLMAGRIPVTATEARIPDSLDEVVVGAVTAREIRWVR